LTAQTPRAAPTIVTYGVLLGDALANLRVRPAKSLLALIGIAMGTAAVIALLHIGANARAEALRGLEDVGSDFVTIMAPIGAMTKAPIRLEDVNEIPLAQTGLSAVAPMIQGAAQVIEGREQWQANVIGTTKALLPLLRMRLGEGRFVSEFDAFEPFAVIGAEIAEGLSAARGRRVAIGDRFRIGAEFFRIIGILAPHPFNPVTGLAPDKSVLVNLKSARRLIAPPLISAIAARMSPGAIEGRMTGAVKDYFRPRLAGAEVVILDAATLIASIERQMQIYNTLLLAIGGVSLAIGGVGIMNVMLMAVMERQEEIGLRAAVGASPKAIRTMFLMESVALAAAGSAAGLFIGIGAGWVFAVRSGWRFEFSPAALPLGLAMAVAVGLFFGIYPAHRAASLHPIQALRRE
jgi:putative ABC transport system permease protein